MKFLLERSKSAAPIGSGAAVSIVAHALLIAAAVQATRPPATLENRQWIANRIFYIPPPNRVLGQPGAHETLRFVEIAPNGTGSGAATGIPQADATRPSLLSDLGTGHGRDAKTHPPAPRLMGPDSAYSIVDVDSEAVRDPESGAPVYPLGMLQAGIEGIVSARYVVDTSGHADPASVVIMASTAPEFTAAVRTALQTMRFTPARIGALKVRQLVQQDFHLPDHAGGGGDSRHRPHAPATSLRRLTT